MSTEDVLKTYTWAAPDGRELHIRVFYEDVDSDDNPRHYDEVVTLAAVDGWDVDLGDIDVRLSRKIPSLAAATVELGHVVAIAPLWMYDHGFHRFAIQPWGREDPDNFQVGWVFIRHQEAKRHNMLGPAWTPKRYRDLLASAVRDFDAYSNGEFYGYLALDDGVLAELEGSFRSVDEALGQAAKNFTPKELSGEPDLAEWAAPDKREVAG